MDFDIDEDGEFVYEFGEISFDFDLDVDFDPSNLITEYIEPVVGKVESMEDFMRGLLDSDQNVQEIQNEPSDGNEHEAQSNSHILMSNDFLGESIMINNNSSQSEQQNLENYYPSLICDEILGMEDSVSSDQSDSIRPENENPYSLICKEILRMEDSVLSDHSESDSSRPENENSNSLIYDEFFDMEDSMIMSNINSSQSEESLENPFSGSGSYDLRDIDVIDYDDGVEEAQKISKEVADAYDVKIPDDWQKGLHYTEDNEQRVMSNILEISPSNLVTKLSACHICHPSQFFDDRPSGITHMENFHNLHYCHVCFKLMRKKDLPNHIRYYHMIDPKSDDDEVHCLLCFELISLEDIYQHLDLIHLKPTEEADHNEILELRGRHAWGLIIPNVHPTEATDSSCEKVELPSVEVSKNSTQENK